jgi:hypothetical protein
LTREELAELFRIQSRYCRLLGSPMYELLLARAADDLLAGGPTLHVLRGHENDPPRSFLHLRLMGSVHRLVLTGEAPELAALYPSVGGTAELDRVWPAFRATLERLDEPIRAGIDAPVQTNEVGRSAGLLGGFLTVARRTGLPLRVLEVGASAGLLMGFDRYRYESGAKSWGDPRSPVRFHDFIDGDSFPWEVDTSVAEARGCDANPLDPSDPATALLLRGFVWPDQSERFELLSAALDFAAANPIGVEKQDAGEWVEEALASPRSGVATVLYHSIVLHYLSDASRSRLLAAIERAGEGASDAAPFAWLRLELGGDMAAVELTTWPGGEERLIARAGYQGPPVKWLS